MQPIHKARWVKIATPNLRNFEIELADPRFQSAVFEAISMVNWYFRTFVWPETQMLSSLTGIECNLQHVSDSTFFWRRNQFRKSLQQIIIVL
jgi:hypothetical protein